VTDDSVARVAEFRMLTDPVIARYAVERGTKAHLAELHDCVEELRHHLAAGKFEVYTRASRRFYVALAHAADNIHLEEAAKHVYNFDARLLYLAARSDTEWKALSQTRLQNAAMIVDCMKRRRPSEAEAGVKLYLVRYFDEISRLVKEKNTETVDDSYLSVVGIRN
jgi:DNA-binding GntR family transcriptional regulator